MDIKCVQLALDGISGMPFYNAVAIEKILRRHNACQVLELGCLHGVSSCYMAAVLQSMDEEAAGGTCTERRVTTIDLRFSEALTPNVVDLAERLGLDEYIKPYFETTSYNWRLMKMLDEGMGPTFDLVYIDGAHNWYTDGLAFFLADKLLKVGGVMILDDLPWTYDTSPSLKGQEWVIRKPKEEKTTQQIRKVFNLLVRQHPNYGNCREQGAWGVAEKLKG